MNTTATTWRRARGITVAAAVAAAAAAGSLAAGAGPAHAQEAAAPDAPLADPEPYAELLERIVEWPRVDYRVLTERRALLDRYVDELAGTDPDRLAAASEAHRLAFWINAYNACMLVRVANHYPIEPSDAGLLTRLRNRVAGRPANSVWQIEDVFTGAFCPVAGRERSLDEIEHEIIRPRFGEPRIHFAINCAAASCPPLAAEPYDGERLDEQLDRAVERFVANPDHFRLEASADPPRLRVNRVLDWFSEDFGGEEGIPAFFEPYVSSGEREALRDPDLRLSFFEYDWTLNDVRATGEDGPVR